MPELPEVEVIRQGLAEKLPGRRVKLLEVREPRIFIADNGLEPSRLKGQRFLEVNRRGKFLILKLERHVLLIHLGMTGQLTFWNQNEPDAQRFQRHPVTGLQWARQHGVDKHTHLTCFFDDGNALHYRDTRMFGRVRLLRPASVEGPTLLGGLGPEPLETAFVREDFAATLHRTTRPIKAVLLDQSVVAGVGNIYADEALFLAGVRPTKRAHQLTLNERHRIYEAVPQVLRKGIEHRGTTLRDYIDSEGRQGSNQELLLVYGREGQPCPTCGTPIKRIVVAQRSSHYCPICQGGKRGSS